MTVRASAALAQTGAMFNVQIGDRFTTEGALAAFNNAGLFH
jgi:hypothetical protein